MPAPAFGEPEAVPASDGPQLDLIDMWAAAVEPKLGGPLMKALAAAAPLTGLQHIKRIRKGPQRLEILLCRADWREQQQRQQQQQAAGGSAPGSQQPAEGGGAAPEAAAAGDSQQAALPPAVQAVVQQHGLQPFLAQVRSCGVAVRRGESWSNP